MRHKQVLRSYAHGTGKHSQFSAVYDLYKIIQLSGLEVIPLGYSMPKSGIVAVRQTIRVDESSCS